MSAIIINTLKELKQKLPETCDSLRGKEKS